MKPKFIVFLVIIAAFVIYLAPGFRAKAENLFTKYGGWTEEAIRERPGDFIAHARKKLEENLASFESSKKALVASKKTAEERLAHFSTQLANADTLAHEFKTAYQTAKAAGNFPITLVNRPYTEPEAVEQVQLVLGEKKNAQARIGEYETILAKVEQKRAELTERINSTKSKLDELAAQEEMVKIDKLTADADALLAQVNDLVIENGKALESETAGPVRSIADLMKDSETKSGGTTTEPKAEAVAFLNG